MMDKKGSYKIEFENLSDGSLEVRYFDDYDDSSYQSWRLPKEVVEELIDWWKELKKNKNINFPIKTKTKNCEFNMRTEKYIVIREFDALGRYKLAGWNLPKVAVEELIDRDEKSLKKKTKE